MVRCDGRQDWPITAPFLDLKMYEERAPGLEVQELPYREGEMGATKTEDLLLNKLDYDYHKDY